MSETTPTKYSLGSLLAAPKGNIEYLPDNAFMLHVFWETPSMEAAQELLSALQRCANATHRDTPCVPTYFFRISQNDVDICASPPRKVGDHPHIRSAIKKLQVGVAQHAVRSELVSRQIDPTVIDDLDLNRDLPESMQKQPVRVECTEIYLDERAFMEHAGSREYLDAYGKVMNPAMQYTVPITMRLGNPVARIVDGILEPILKENVAPLLQGCSVWRRTASMSDDNENKALFISLDVVDMSPETVAAKLGTDFQDHCTTFVTFPHPLRDGTTRIMFVVPRRSSLDTVLARIAELQPVRGEVHVDKDEAVEAVQGALASAGMASVTVNQGEKAGYVLHAKASEIRENAQQN